MAEPNDLDQMGEDAYQPEHDDELSEFHHDPADDAQEEEQSIESSAKSRRGRPRIPECWVHAILVDDLALQKMKIKVIATDLLLAETVP